MNSEIFKCDFLDHLTFMRQDAGIRKARTPDFLIHSASALFSRQGYNKTSLEQITEYAGVSIQGVYGHFNGKEDLALAAMSSLNTRCYYYLLEAMRTPALSSEMQYQKFYYILKRFFIDNPEAPLPSYLAIEFMGMSDLLEKSIQRFCEQWIYAIQDLLQYKLPREKAIKEARKCLLGLQNAVITHRLYQESVDLIDFYEDYIHLYKPFFFD